MQKSWASFGLRLGPLAIGSLMICACATLEDAVDPDCTADKAARNAATQATVGLPSNRCTPGEAARDIAGVDG